MDFRLNIVVVVIIIAGIILFIKECYDSSEHRYCKDVSKMREDSRPVRVEQKTVGIAGRRHIRTTVYFDDGFWFVSHKCNRKNYGLFYSVDCPEELKAEIVEDAIRRHQDEVAMRNRERQRKK